MNVKTTARAAALVAAGLLGLVGSVQVNAQPMAAESDAVTCREVMRRVAVWPQTGNPSKGVRPATFETRKYRICMRDGVRVQETRIAAR